MLRISFLFVVFFCIAIISSWCEQAPLKNFKVKVGFSLLILISVKTDMVGLLVETGSVNWSYINNRTTQTAYIPSPTWPAKHGKTQRVWQLRFQSSTACSDVTSPVLLIAGIDLIHGSRNPWARNRIEKIIVINVTW